MKTKLSLLLAIFFLSLIVACSDDDTSGGESTPKPSSNLEVTVEIETDTGLVNAPGAKIYLFEFKEYRDEFSHILFQGATDAFGKYTFIGLEKDEYWIKIELPQPDGRTKNFYDNDPFPTPTANSVLLNRLLATFKK